MADCLFCKIVAGEVPGKKVYETDDVLAFRDINPQAPTHVLIVPKVHVTKVADLEDGQSELAGKLLLAARDVARQLGVQDFRLNVNNGATAGQSVWHVHVHLLAGRDFAWPPG